MAADDNMVDVIANVATIVTAVAAVWAYSDYRYKARQNVFASNGTSWTKKLKPSSLIWDTDWF
jgi:hypothetical protein